MEPERDTKEITKTANRTNRRAVRAIVIPFDTKKVPTAKQLVDAQDDTSKSKEMPEDPFLALAAEGRVIEAPFDMLTLAMLSEHNTELGQCIEAMIENIEGFGAYRKRMVGSSPQSGQGYRGLQPYPFLSDATWCPGSGGNRGQSKGAQVAEGWQGGGGRDQDLAALSVECAE